MFNIRDSHRAAGRVIIAQEPAVFPVYSSSSFSSSSSSSSDSGGGGS